MNTPAQMSDSEEALHSLAHPRSHLRMINRVNVELDRGPSAVGTPETWFPECWVAKDLDLLIEDASWAGGDGAAIEVNEQGPVGRLNTALQVGLHCLPEPGE